MSKTALTATAGLASFSLVGCGDEGGLVGVHDHSGEVKQALLFSDYLAGGADPTAAAQQMLVDAEREDGRTEIVFNHEGTVELKENFVFDFPAKIVLESQARLRQAPNSRLRGIQRSRHSGVGHTAMFMLLEAACGSELEFYGQIDANLTGNYKEKGAQLANRPIMVLGAHDVHIHGEWTFVDASVGVWAIDCDRLRVYGIGSESAGSTAGRIGNGGTIVGVEGCRWVRAGNLWGKGVGELVDINSRNRYCYIEGVEAEGTNEVIDINNSRNVTVRDVRARNCRKVLTVYNNSDGHITERSSVSSGNRGYITAESFHIDFDEDMAAPIGPVVFKGDNYQEGSNYTNIRFSIRGANPARFIKGRKLCSVGSRGGEIDVSYRSDVAVDAERNFEFTGENATVRFVSRAPIARGRAAMTLGDESESLRVVSPRIMQTGEPIRSENRIGIDARGGVDNDIVDPHINEGHFDRQIVR